MKPHITEQRFDFRGGRNTAISPDLLNPNELVDCTNARLSSVYGGFAKRTGSQRIHQTAFSAAINGVFQWDGPSGKQVVVISGGSLWFRNGFLFNDVFAQAVLATTLRTTQNQGINAAPDNTHYGWVALAGGDTGTRTTSQTGTGTSAVNNDLACKLGDPHIDNNIPSVDNNYKLTEVKVIVDASALTTGLALGYIKIQASTDNGATWNDVSLQQSFEAHSGSINTYTPSFLVNFGNSAIIHAWVRVVVSTFVQGTGTATTTAQVFNTAYGTDPFPVTWNTGSAPFSTNQPAFFAPFRGSAAGAPLWLFIASGGHYYKWDGINVTQLDAPPNTNQVPGATSIISYHTRMIAMVASNLTPGQFPKTIFWSVLGDATDFRTGDKTKGGSAVTDFLTGQQLVALEVIGSSLLLATSDSIMRFTGHASDDIVIAQDTEGISAEIGAVGPQAFKRYENIAALFSDRGPYAVTETYAEPSGEQLNPDWFGLDNANLSNVVIEYNRGRKELFFAVPRVGDGGVPKTIFSMSVRLQAWQGPWIYPFAIGCMCKYFDVNNTPNVLSGSPDGFVRLMDVGSLDDVLFDGTGGSNITMTVEFPVMHFQLPGLKKALKWCILQANLPTNSTPSLNIAFDGAGFTNYPITPNDNGEEDYRVDVAGDTSQGFRVRMQFTDNSAQPITVNGFTLTGWNYGRTT